MKDQRLTPFYYAYRAGSPGYSLHFGEGVDITPCRATGLLVIRNRETEEELHARIRNSRWDDFIYRDRIEFTSTQQSGDLRIFHLGNTRLRLRSTEADGRTTCCTLRLQTGWFRNHDSWHIPMLRCDISLHVQGGCICHEGELSCLAILLAIHLYRQQAFYLLSESQNKA